MTTLGRATGARTFTVPDLGEGLTEVEIIVWRVAPGDHVGVDQVVADVETAKATVAVPCPYAGRVVELHAEVGAAVPVGAALITVADDEPATGAAQDGPASDVGAAGPVPDETNGGSGAVLVGYGTGSASTGRRRRLRGRSVASEPAARNLRPRVISPVVRRLARDRGVDLTSLPGSGPAGVIVRRDVEGAPDARHAAAPSVPSATAGSALPGERTVLRGVRRTVAERLTRSRDEIPDATTWVDVDATALIEARDALRAARPEPAIGVLALIGRFVSAGLRRFPDLNTSVERDGDDLVVVHHGAVNLGFAAQTERGLVVPVVHGADAMTLTELAVAVGELTAAARAGTLGPAQLTGGTFTLNNYGVFGVDGSTPIINHPEAALLGVGRITDKPWVVGGELAARKVTQVSLTFDHRVCDGGVAGGFLRYVADCMEAPVSLLADV